MPVLFHIEDVSQPLGHSTSGSHERYKSEERLKWEDVCFVGDDIVDLGPLQRAGVAVAVANGVAEAKAAAHLVTREAGGHGAVREVVELILKAQGKWDNFVAHYTK